MAMCVRLPAGAAFPDALRVAPLLPRGARATQADGPLELPSDASLATSLSPFGRELEAALRTKSGSSVSFDEFLLVVYRVTLAE